MALRILSAIYRKNGIEKIITLSEITKEKYEKEYKGYLYCPNPDCTARIIFASGDKRTYFRTWRIKLIDKNEIVDQHIPGCQYYVERELEERVIARNDPNLYYKLSSNHKRNVLRRAYDYEFNAEKFKKTKNDDEKSHKRASSKSRIDRTIQARGRAGLGSDGAVEGAEREPPVYRKQIDDISDADSDSVHCVTGYVNDLVYDNYYYFTFVTRDGRNARILISEAFAVNNPTQYDNIGIYKKYIDFRKKNGIKPFVCCIGKITKDEYGISIIPEEYVDIELDRKGYYGILNEINNLFES